MSEMQMLGPILTLNFKRILKLRLSYVYW